MSDMTHSQAEEALATGDEQDVAEALEAEREESESAPEEAAMSTTSTERRSTRPRREDEAELEAIAEEDSAPPGKIFIKDLQRVRARNRSRVRRLREPHHHGIRVPEGRPLRNALRRSDRRAWRSSSSRPP